MFRNVFTKHGTAEILAYVNMLNTKGVSRIVEIPVKC